jgi:hypothetical protein
LSIVGLAARARTITRRQKAVNRRENDGDAVSHQSVITRHNNIKVVAATRNL